nr:MAG TPA: hypothetical protein [Caudoviricetes sp.]
MRQAQFSSRIIVGYSAQEIPRIRLLSRPERVMYGHAEKAGKHHRKRRQTQCESTST